MKISERLKGLLTDSSRPTASVIKDLNAAEPEVSFSLDAVRQAIEDFAVAAENKEAKEEDFWSSFFRLFEVVYGSPHRTEAKIHPSGLMYDCPRRMTYEISGVSPTDKRLHSAETLRIFHTGTFWHTYIQARLYRKGRLVKMEVPVISKRLLIDGRADGIVRFDHDDALLEIKTMNSFGFYKLTAPLEQHLFQASIYAKILGLKKILFVYINKDNSKLKEFLVSRDDEMFDNAVAIINLVKAHVREGTLPDRLCPNTTCSRAKTCNYRSHCFSRTHG